MFLCKSFDVAYVATHILLKGREAEGKETSGPHALSPIKTLRILTKRPKD